MGERACLGIGDADTVSPGGCGLEDAAPETGVLGARIGGQEEPALDYVYIAYALDDGDEVGPLAAMLRGAGYAVRFGPLVEPGVNHRERVETELKGALAVLVIWSSHSVASPRVRADAGFAADWGNLVGVRIDAAAIPLAGGALVDLSDGQSMSSGQGAKAILAAIGLLPSVPSANPASPPPGVVDQIDIIPRPQRDWRGIIVVSAIAVAALVGVAFAMLVSPALSGASDPDRREPPELAGAPSPEAPAAVIEASASEALLRWGDVPKDDAMALRAFLASYGATNVAEQARAALSRLERTAWERVTTARDAGAVLAALEAYRIDFSDGLFAEEAVTTEARERRRIGEAQELLQRAGLSRTEPDGILRPETVAAVRSFQSSVGLPPSGLIDAGLLVALRAGGSADAGAPTSAGDVVVETKAAAVAGPPFRDCYVCPELVPLPAGHFVMGDQTGAASPDERPAHEVKLAYRLAVGRFEVTFEEWDACQAEGGCRHTPGDGGKGRGRHPVVDVSPADIDDYLGWLSRKTGKRYRLLSEAEWEYAARAGETSAWHAGNQPGALCAYGNGADAGSAYAWRNPACADGYADGAAPVGAFKPNAFGLYDIMGNVWEWTADCWHSTYAAAPADGSAWVHECEGADRVLRGGAYSVDIDKMRSSYRYHFAPKRMPFFGFRVARPFD